jgi:hypothetical protein
MLFALFSVIAAVTVSIVDAQQQQPPKDPMTMAVLADQDHDHEDRLLTNAYNRFSKSGKGKGGKGKGGKGGMSMSMNMGGKIVRAVRVAWARPV